MSRQESGIEQLKRLEAERRARAMQSALPSPSSAVPSPVPVHSGLRNPQVIDPQRDALMENLAAKDLMNPQVADPLRQPLMEVVPSPVSTDIFAEFGGRALAADDPFAEFGGHALPVQAEAAPAPVAGPPESTFATVMRRSGLDSIAELLKGGGKGALKTFGLEPAKMLGMVPPETSMEDIGMQPEGPVQQLGMGAEQVGEYFIPGMAAARIPRLARLGMLGRAGTEAIGAAGVTALQTGGDPKAIAEAGALSAAIPLVGGAVAPIKKLLVTRLPSRLVDSIIKPSRSQLRFGREPGQEVAAQGLKANTLDGLEREIIARKKEVGKTADGLLRTAGAGKKVDVVDAVVKPIDEAIGVADRLGKPELVARLEALKKGQLMKRKGMTLTTMPKSLKLSPVDARAMKTELGDSIHWTEDPIEKSVNGVIQKIYHNLNDLIEAAVPGSKKYNSQYSNLLSAEKAVEARKDAVKKLNFIGMTEAAMSATSALVGAAMHGDLSSAAVSGLLGLGVSKAARASNTAVYTRLAAQLAQLTPGERTMIATRVIPLLRNLGLAANAQAQSTERAGQK